MRERLIFVIGFIIGWIGGYSVQYTGFHWWYWAALIVGLVALDWLRRSYQNMNSNPDQISTAPQTPVIPTTGQTAVQEDLIAYQIISQLERKEKTDKLNSQLTLLSDAKNRLKSLLVELVIPRHRR